MKILIYHDSHQETFYQRLLNQSDTMTSIHGAYDLQSLYNINACPILVIISQPQKQFLDTLMAFNWSSIVCFVGIRNIKHIKAPCFYFDNDLEFQEKMKLSIAEQANAIKKNYLNQLEISSAEDAEYLTQISGISTEFGTFKKDKTKRFKKLERSGLITVMGNPLIASDIAKTLAMKTSGKVLIIDGDFMKPSLDNYFGISSLQTPIKSHLSGIDNTGINIALDTMVKGFDLEQGIDSFTKKGGRNLSVLLGNYNLYNYEHFDEKQIKLLISKLHNYFQIIVLHVSDYPYDSLTMLGLHMSAINIVTCPNSIQEVRYKFNLLKILSAKQGLPNDKNLLLSYDANGNESKVGETVFKNLFTKSYFGHYKNKKELNGKWIEKITERMKVWD